MTDTVPTTAAPSSDTATIDEADAAVVLADGNGVGRPPAPLDGPDTGGDPGDDPQLRRKVGGALKWSFVNATFTRLTSVGVSILLAHLIAPEQFGVYAAALVVINIILSISEMGVSVALVRHTGPIDEMAPTVTTLALISAFTLGMISLLGAPWFASALGAPEATGVIRLLSVSIALAGITAVPTAILQRDFRQDHKMLADTMSFVTSTGVVIGLAAAGFGAWALAWSRIVATITVAVVMLALTKERYWPGWSSKQAKDVLAFGLPLAGSSLLVFGVMNVDYIVVGSVLGSVPLGYYLIAFNLSSWPVNAFSEPVRTVSTAGFSQLRHDPERFQASFTRALGALMALTIPACVILAALNTPLVRFVYGERWLPAAVPLAVLGVLGALRVGLELAYDFLAAAGKSRSILVVHILWFAGLVPALLIGAHLGGITGVSWGHVVVVTCVVAPAYAVALRGLGIGVRGIGRAVTRPLIGGVVMIGVAQVASRLMPNDFLRLAVGATAALLAYGAVVWPTRRELLSIVKKTQPEEPALA